MLKKDICKKCLSGFESGRFFIRSRNFEHYWRVGEVYCSAIMGDWNDYSAYIKIKNEAPSNCLYKLEQILL
jgi:hypothetical protein